MKNTIKDTIIFPISAIITFYLMVSFVEWQINPKWWSETTRMGLCFLIIIAIVLYVLIIGYLIEEQSMQK